MQYSSVRSTHSLPAKDVDGLLVTGASQDHFLGFHYLTILTDQGDIKEIFLISKSYDHPYPLLYSGIGVLQSNVVLEHELCVKFSLTNVAIRLTFFVVLSKVSPESICITENFATILAGSPSPLSGVHRLTV